MPWSGGGSALARRSRPALATGTLARLAPDELPPGLDRGGAGQVIAAIEALAIDGHRQGEGLRVTLID
ncbi:MAG: hypothetical protein P4M00_04745 [Azospirillaceae bacterium]|nr:hypothetical protein [Azospirillaceae bacterium]